MCSCLVCACVLMSYTHEFGCSATFLSASVVVHLCTAIVTQPCNNHACCFTRTCVITPVKQNPCALLLLSFRVCCCILFPCGLLAIHIYVFCVLVQGHINTRASVCVALFLPWNLSVHAHGYNHGLMCTVF